MLHERLLTHFPEHVHPLTLVTDPDYLLADEEIAVTLADRGFTVLSEADPVQLRYHLVRHGEFSTARPLIVATDGSLNQLPYDLWQQGIKVNLVLHSFYPKLAYPIVRKLSPNQRRRLSQVPSPSSTLGRRATCDHLLQHVFDARPVDLQTHTQLLVWFATYHQQSDPLPAELGDHLLDKLNQSDMFRDWPLAEVLADHAIFTSFVNDQWVNFVQGQTGEFAKKTPGSCVLDFKGDSALQDSIAQLVRMGSLVPLRTANPNRLPAWARPATLARDENVDSQRASELMTGLGELLAEAPEQARWEQWTDIAWHWAELSILQRKPGANLPVQITSRIPAMAGLIDSAFLSWLQKRYAPLGGQKLPSPHHLHHVPHYLAYQRRQGECDRLALLIMDGMALVNWLLIRPVWRARNPQWRMQERLVLAQIPTITAVSRQALISGQRPATLNHNRAEPGQWKAFWQGQNVAANQCALARLSLDRSEPPPEIRDHRITNLCLIDNTVDEVIHGANFGARDVQASITLWLEEHSQKLEDVISYLLKHDFTVFLVSDHGHIEAEGTGSRTDGVLVKTRSHRARLYSDENIATQAQAALPKTFLWHCDGLLPTDTHVVLPTGRTAFTTEGDVVVTHGGLALEEMAVPLVSISGQLASG